MAVKSVAQLGFADGRLSDRPGYPALVLVKALLLQAMYGSSDRELHGALCGRLSLADAVPDHSALNRFRNRLVSEGSEGKLFAELHRQLGKAGVMLKRETMLDATLIPTSSAPPSTRASKRVGTRGGHQRPASDPDAAFARREERAGSVFGYKAHVGVDEGSGLIRTVLTTPANINDTTPADALTCGDEAAVYADEPALQGLFARSLRDVSQVGNLMSVLKACEAVAG